MSVEWWPRRRGSGIPPAVVIRTRRSKIVVEFGRTVFLPFQCRQVLRTRVLSVWVDEASHNSET